jgi:hypothetical protein
MAGQADLGQIAEADYSRILRTLSESVTGRAFLFEYRRRTRPEETNALLAALVRIEDSIASVRDCLRPERLADELRYVAMTLEVAAEDAEADPEGDPPARRMALVNRAREELTTLAETLEPRPAADQDPDASR